METILCAFSAKEKNSFPVQANVKILNIRIVKRFQERSDYK